MIKRADRLPTDLVADEKHSWLNGQRVYIATTSGQACIVGASVSQSAGQADLMVAYGVFAEEAQVLDSAYAPHTVNPDVGSPLKGLKSVDATSRSGLR